MNSFSISVEGDTVTVESEDLTYSEFIPRILRSMEVIYGYEFDKQRVIESFAYDWLNNYSTEAYSEGFSQALEQINELLLPYKLKTDGKTVKRQEKQDVERSELAAYTDTESGFSEGEV